MSSFCGDARSSNNKIARGKPENLSTFKLGPIRALAFKKILTKCSLRAGAWTLDFWLAGHRAVHRNKPVQNFVIRAGFFFFFLNRVGNGLSIFAPRPGPG